MQHDAIDIAYRSENGSLEKRLSNLYPYYFELDGMPCASMEGFLQSLKFEDEQKAAEVRASWGLYAWSFSAQGESWKQKQTLCWQQEVYDRHGVAYQRLLDAAFCALSQNFFFKNTLISSAHAKLVHSMGDEKTANETCLTSQEYCSRLIKLREELLAD